MTGKSPQQTGTNLLIHSEFAGDTTDHSNYCTGKHNGTQEKIHNREQKTHSFSATV